MGIERKTYHIRNGQPANTEPEEVEKRLVILFEDTFKGLNIEQAVFLKVLIESWLTWQ